MATNKNNVDTESKNIFMLSGDEEKVTPYDYDGMPEFNQPNGEAYCVMKIRFRSEDDIREFAKVIGQNSITGKTKSIWFPALDKKRNSLLRWIDDEE
jgi:hypothetical protein